jgi:hypothetical protein
MMLISSAFFLAISVFVKNKMANRAIRLFYDKHEENIFFTNAVAVVQGILQGEGNLFEKNKKKVDQENLFLYLYWLHGNRWIDFVIKNDQYNKKEMKISIFLEFEEGKVPLSRMYEKYADKAKKKEEKEDTYKNESSEGKLSQNGEEGSDKKLDEQEQDKKKETIVKGDSYLSSMKSFLLSLDEHSLIKELFSDISSAKKKEVLWKTFEKKLSQKKGYFFCFDQMTEYRPHTLYGYRNFSFRPHQINKDKKMIHLDKTLSFYDICSLEESQAINLAYISPFLLSLLSESNVTFSQEVREKIYTAWSRYFTQKKSSKKIEETWKEIFEKNCGVPFPKKKIGSFSPETLFSIENNIPSFITAFIVISFEERKIAGVVVLEKNEKYDTNTESDKNKKKNKDYNYLIKAIRIFP